MSGFWTSEMGEVTGKAEDAFAKSFRIIPDGTMALARIDKFSSEIHKDSGYKYLEIKWVITDGEFKSQNVSQKIKVFDSDAKVRHRALNMLKLIYQLFNTKPKHNGEPTNEDLAFFTNKVAGIKVRETEPNEEGKQYNWVAEVHSSQGFKCETGVKLEVIHKVQPESKSAFDRNPRGSDPGLDGLDDDIPF